MNISFIAFAAIILGSAAPLAAQGTSCATATPIVGEASLRWIGAPPLDISGPMVPAYFQWTAPLAGDYWFDTGSSIGTTELLAGLGTGCGTTFTHNATGGPGDGITLLGVQAGDTYLVNSAVRFSGHPANEGALNVVRLTAACQGLGDDIFEPNDGSFQGPIVQDGNYTGLWASNFEWDYYTMCLAPGATMQADVFFSHADGNIDFHLGLLDPILPQHFQGPFAVGDSHTDNEQVSYTNASGRSVTVSLRVRCLNWSYQQKCIPYSLQIAGVGHCPWTSATFCDPMDANSTGLSTRLSATTLPGSVSRVHFDVDQGPPSQFAYFLVGTGASNPGLSLGQGRLCLSVAPFNQLYRYNLAGTEFNSLGRFQPDGTLLNISGTSAAGPGYDLPTSIPNPFYPNGAPILSGRSWYFQVWHRDVGGQSNFSNGVRIDF